MFVYVKNKNRKTAYNSLVLAIAIGILVTGWFDKRPSFAQSVTPSIEQISLSASLFGSDSRIITNGTYDVRFAIYSTDRATADPYPSNTDSGTRLWEETQGVTVKNGILRVFLGSVTPLPASLNFETGNYYIGIRIGEDSEMVPRKKLGSVPRAINSEFLQGRTIGTAAGNIPILGNRGKIDVKNLPTGTGNKQLVLGNDSRLQDSHQQNTDTGTDSETFNIGSGTALSGTNFDLTVSDQASAPALRYNGTTSVWQFSNNGSTFSDLSDGGVDLLSTADGTGSTSSNSGMELAGASADQLALLQGCSNGQALSWNDSTNVWECASFSSGISGSGTNGYAAYWSGTSSLSAEAQLSVSRGGTGVNASGAGNGALLIGTGTGFTLNTLTGSTGLGITNASGSITFALDVTTTSTTVTTSSNSGLEIGSDGLRMLGGCSNDQVLAWSSGSSAWVCSNKTGGTSDWSNGGSFTYLTDTTDDVVFGGATTDTGFFFDVSASTLAFEGTTANAFETTLAVTEPTADNTITFPNVSGTVITSGNLTDITAVGTIASGTWNGTTIAVANGGTGATTLTNLIALTTHTTGNYVATITAGNGISGSSSTEGGTPTIAIDLLDSADGAGATSSNSGLEFQGTGTNELGLLQGCATNEVLSWNDTTNVWACASVSGVGGVTGTGTSGQVAYWTGTSTISSEAQLSVSRGGTGIGSYTIGDILYASGTTTLARLADVATGSVLLSGGVGIAPSWGQITSSHVTVDSLDFTELQDTLDLDAALVLNQTTNTWSQTFTGTTTTGLTYTATSLTTGSALNLTTTNTATTNTALSAAQFNITNAQATLANTNGIVGASINFTNNPSIAGNTEYAFQIQNQATANITDNAVAALLRLDNADTSTSGSTGITDAIVISASGGLATTTAFTGNWLNTPNIDLTSAGAISGATGVSSSGTITFSAFSSNGGVLYTNGSGTLAQATAGTSTQVLHGGTSPSFGAVVLTTDVSGNLPLANGGTGASLSDPNADRIFFWDDSAGSTDWLSVSSNLSISGTTLDVDATLQLGSDGTDGVLTIYSEQGATDFSTIFQPGTQTQDVTYTLPNDDGTSGQVLVTNGTGTLSWSSVSGAGGVTGTGTTGYAAYWDSSTSIAAEQYLSLTRGGTGTTLTDPNADRILFWDESSGASGSMAFLSTSGNLSISGTTLDVDATLQLGSDGTDGVLTIYSEQGATDFSTIFQPGTQTQNVTYTLPNDDGGASQVLITNGTGTLSWSTVSGAGAVDGSGAANQAVYWVDTDTLAGEAQLDETRGGTGIGTYTTGDLLYASGTDTLAKRAIGSSGQVLVVSGGLPTWSTLGGGGVTDDSLDFVQFEDTMDLDAALVLNQTTNTWSQTFTGTTTTGLTYTASSLTTGSALNLTTTNTATTNTALSAAQFNLTNAQSTLANTNGIVGATINFTNNPSIAGNTEYAFRIQNQATSNTTDNAVAALLLLDNADTTTSGTTVVTDAIRITDSGGADFTNFLNTDTIDISAAGTITSATWQGNTIDVAYGGTGATSLTNLIALTTHTTGNYVASLANGNGITGGAAGSEGATLTLAIDLLDSADGAGSTSTNSGLEFQGTGTNELSLLQGCANNEVLSWNDSTNVWTCSSVSGVGGVTGTGTSGDVAYWTGTSTISSEAQLSVSRGGTGIGSYTIGDLLYASGTTTLAKLADVATGSVLLSGGVGIAPSWGQIAASHVTVDSLDFTEFQDTLDLDAALVLNQTTNTWSQTFTGTTTTGLTYTANSLTTGTALNVTSSSSPTGASSSSNAITFNLTQSAGTNATTYTGVDLLFTNAPTVAGNTEYAFRIQNQATSNTTDNAVAALLLLDNADTTGTGTTVVTDAIRITNSGGSDFTNFLNTPTVDISAAGGITGATGITSSGTITFSAFTTAGGLLYTNGSGVVSQTAQGTATTVLHGGATPSYSGVSLTTDVTGTLPLTSGGTNKNMTAAAGAVAYSDADSLELTAVGTSGQCLISNGTSAPSWTACTSAATSPFSSASGIISKVTAGDRLSLIYGDAGDTQFEIENTTNTVLPTADVMAMNLTGGTAGITTDGVDLLSINGEFGNGTSNVNSGIHIDIDPVNTPSGDETFYAINIDGLSAGTSATETAINIGSNWDTILNSPTLDISAAGAITGATGITSSGTITFSGLTANSFLYSGTGGALTTTSAPTNGQLLIGSTGAAPVAATLTAGNGITITNGAGSIAFAVDATTTGTTAVTSANSGIESTSAGIRLLGGCSNDQVLGWNSSSSVWECSDKTGGTSDWTDSGTITYLTSTTDDLAVGGTTGTNSRFFLDVTTGNQIVFEGTGADDGSETFLVITNPSADRTVTIPNATGTVVTTGNLTDITATGTIASGTWNGTVVGLAFGGTNKNMTAAAGAVAYSDSDSLELTAVGVAAQCLVSNGTSAPSWADCTSAASSPFNASSGVITKVTAGDRLSLIYGDAADTQLTIENTTNNVIPSVDVMAMSLTGNTTGIVTDGVDLLFIGGEFGNGTSNVNSGIHIDIDPVNTPSGDETFYAINIDGLSAGTSATETAINIGSNWDNILDSPTLDISAAGVLNWSSDVTLTYTTDTLTMAGGSLNIGAPTTSGTFNVQSTSVLGANFTNTSGSGATAGSGIIGYSDDGAALASGDRLGYFLLGGSTNASHTLANAAGMSAYATEAWSGSANGAALYFEVTPAGSTTRARYLGLDSTSLTPFSNDLISLGTSSLMFSDLFLASGGVINFNNGDVTLTHSTDAFALMGGNFGVGDATPAALFTVGDGDDFQINTTGAITAATSITSSGTITFSGLSTAGIVTNTSGGVLGTTVSVPIANGGTNATTIGSAGSVPYSTGSAYAFSAVGTTGQAMISGGTGAPTWYAPTAGSILFAGTSGILQQDNANFFWDDSNNRLGLGTAAPTTLFEMYGSAADIVSTITVADATYDPILKFRTGSTPAIQFSMGVDNSDSDKFKIFSGDGLGSGDEFVIDSNGVTTIANLNLGASTFDENAGIVSWMDMSVTSSAAQGTVESYTAQIDGTSLLTVYGESDGAGGVQNLGVGIADSTPDGRLDFDLTITSTTAATQYGANFTVSDTGIVTSSTDTTYGQSFSVTRTGATGGTINTYGTYTLVTTDDAGSGTSTAYGSYIDTGVSGSANADTVYGQYITTEANAGTAYGLYVDSGAGAGTEYSGIFMNGNFGVGDATPTALFTVGTSDAFRIDASGVVGAGTWNGTAIGATYGGTGISTASSTGVPTISSGTWSVASSLGVTLGGTGTATQFTAGSIVFAGASGVYTQDNANFFWDDSNNRLGLGTATPAAQLSILGTSNAIRLSYDASNYASFATASNGNLNITSSNTTESQVVVGNGSSVDSSVAFDGASQDYYSGVDHTTGYFTIGSGFTVGSSTLLAMDSSGNVGIGTGVTAPAARLDLSFSSTSTTGATQYSLRNTASDTGIVTSGTDTTYGAYTTLTRTGATGGTINTYGDYNLVTTDNAGSGTSTAYGSYIDTGVSGTSNADTVYGMYITTEANAGTAYGLYVDSGAAAGTEYAGIFLNGNVGIGTATPGARLNVVSDIASDYAAEVFNDGNATTRWGLLVQSGLDDQTAAGPSTLVQFNDGDGGAVGSITFGSSVTNYNTTSDVRLKRNITDTNLGINDLMDIQVRDYSWRADEDNNITHGFIAQELYEIYPDAVTVPQDSRHWMVDYSKLTPLIVKSIQDQQGQITVQGDNITSISLQTTESVNTLAELQISVDDQLTVVGNNLNALSAKDALIESRLAEHEVYFANDQNRLSSQDAIIAELALNMNDQVSKTTLLETQMTTLTEQVSTLSEFYTTFDLGSLIASDEEGNVDLLTGKLKARILETGGLTIEVVDAEAPTIGTAVILPITQDEDGDGEDDETGADGKSVEIRTRAMIPMVNGSRIFTSFKGNPGAFSWVDKVRDENGEYVGFKIRLSDPISEEIRVDWWLVEQKDNIQ